MKKLILVVLVLFVGSMLAPVQAQVKEKKIIENKSQVLEKSRGADPNIKNGRPTEDVKQEKSRGDLCTIYINNYSPYAVDIYIDGDWVGTLSAYSTSYTYTYPGSTKAYGKSIGGTYTWGPTYFDCDYEYTWNLWE